MNKLFKVKYGYDHTSYAVVKEGGELERAVYAWMEGVPVTLGDRMVHGRNIIAIEPNYHAYTGWSEWYKPTSGEDWEQVKRDCPDFTGIVESTKQHVVKLLSNNQTDLIGSGKSLELIEVTKVEDKPNPLTKLLVEKMAIKDE